MTTSILKNTYRKKYIFWIKFINKTCKCFSGYFRTNNIPTVYFCFGAHLAMTSLSSLMFGIIVGLEKYYQITKPSNDERKNRKRKIQKCMFPGLKSKFKKIVIHNTCGKRSKKPQGKIFKEVWRDNLEAFYATKDRFVESECN